MPARLRQRELAVAIRRDGVAVLAIGGVAAAVAHNPGFLLPLDIAVDAGHPGADLVHQLALTQSQDVVGPFGDTGGGGLDPRQAALGCEPDQTGDPLDAVFRGARVIAEPGVRAHSHQQVRKTLHQNAEIGLRAVFPHLLEPDAVDAAYIDPVKGARDRVETGRVDDDVERVLALAGPNAAPRDALDRRFVEVDQFDVRLVVDLVISGFERHPARAEAVVLRDQLFGDNPVMDALADLARDKFRGERVGLTV